MLLYSENSKRRSSPPSPRAACGASTTVAAPHSWTAVMHRNNQFGIVPPSVTRSNRSGAWDFSFMVSMRGRLRSKSGATSLWPHRNRCAEEPFDLTRASVDRVQHSRLSGGYPHIRPAPGGTAREIEHDLVRSDRHQRLRSLVGGGPDDQHVGVCEQRRNAVAEQRGDVGDLLLDVATVRTSQSGDGHVGIEDPHVASLPDEGLDQRDYGAFAEIVRSGFEGEADYSNLPFPRREHRIYRSANLLLVRRENRGEQ